jgi:hypothetical protein
MAIKLFFTFPPLAKLSYLQGDIISCSWLSFLLLMVVVVVFFFFLNDFHISLDYVLITYKIKYLRILAIRFFSDSN